MLPGTRVFDNRGQNFQSWLLSSNPSSRDNTHRCATMMDNFIIPVSRKVIPKHLSVLEEISSRGLWKTESIGRATAYIRGWQPWQYGAQCKVCSLHNILLHFATDHWYFACSGTKVMCKRFQISIFLLFGYFIMQGCWSYSALYNVQNHLPIHRTYVICCKQLFPHLANDFHTIRILQRNEVGSSHGMEYMAFQNCMAYILGYGLVIGTFISNRHLQIARHMRQHLGQITHYFDLWHIKKSKWQDTWKWKIDSV